MSDTTTSKKKADDSINISAKLRRAFLMSLIIPVLMAVFFLIAPRWLNSKVRSNLVASIQGAQSLSAQAKARNLEAVGKLDFEQICRQCPPGLERFRADLDRAGITANFQYLHWSFDLALGLLALVLTGTGAIWILNQIARKSRSHLIRSYRLAWKIGMGTAFLKNLALAPLLAYGTFEISVLATDSYSPKLVIIMGLGGIAVLWSSVAILLRKVPMEFAEPLSREITSEDAPELWEAVRKAAEHLHTAPPDHIVIGMQFNFYVTELAVISGSGRIEGRTLFISYPVLKHLSADAVLAIIGHELGHFVGDDTRLSREFYPLRHKVSLTMMTLAKSAWFGWTSAQFLLFFYWSFGETEQKLSRERELLADRKAAELTSPLTAARALVKFQVLSEAFQWKFNRALRSQNEDIVNAPLLEVIQNELVPKAAFWIELFEKESPHPLDSHPPLKERLHSLAQDITPDDARTMATDENETACTRWFLNRESLFAKLTTQAAEAVGKMRTRVQAVEATYETEEGKRLLETHFPTQTWQVSTTRIGITVLVLGLVVAGCLAGTPFVPDVLPKLACLGAAAAFAWYIVLYLKRNKGAQLTLWADRIAYTGWKRELAFADITRVSVLQNYWMVTFTFHLKASQPPIWKKSVFEVNRRSVAITLNGLGEKPMVIAQKIYEYHTRQIKE